MVFHALTFSRSRESFFLKTMPNGVVFEHHLRDPSSYNAMKQTCFFYIIIAFLHAFNINRTENVA